MNACVYVSLIGSLLMSCVQQQCASELPTGLLSAQRHNVLVLYIMCVATHTVFQVFSQLNWSSFIPLSRSPSPSFYPLSGGAFACNMNESCQLQYPIAMMTKIESKRKKPLWSCARRTCTRMRQYDNIVTN